MWDYIDPGLAAVVGAMFTLVWLGMVWRDRRAGR